MNEKKVDKIILTNKVDNYMILFNKPYDFETLKFYVNRLVGLKKSIDDMCSELNYTFEVKDIICINVVDKLYYIEDKNE